MPLVVCPTPIGNLEDVTLRVLRELAEADAVLCEDTRRTQVLLDRHGIRARRLVSFHRHNEAETVLLILDGAGFVRVGDESIPAAPGMRIRVGKGVYHGVRTEGQPLRFLSVQSPPILDKEGGRLDLEPLGE